MCHILFFHLYIHSIFFSKHITIVYACLPYNLMTSLDAFIDVVAVHDTPPSNQQYGVYEYQQASNINRTFQDNYSVPCVKPWVLLNYPTRVWISKLHGSLPSVPISIHCPSRPNKPLIEIITMDGYSQTPILSPTHLFAMALTRRNLRYHEPSDINV